MMAKRIVPRISVVQDLLVRRFMRCGVDAGNPRKQSYGFAIREAIRLANSPYPVLHVIVLAIENRKDVYE